jgi:uncharacterized phage protein (TIGR02218 family)
MQSKSSTSQTPKASPARKSSFKQCATMNFDNIETSLADGRPVRLYRFTLGKKSWCYTSGDRPIQHLGLQYETLPGGIIDDGIRQTGQDSPDTITLTAPATLDVAQIYRGIPPSSEVVLTIFDRHIDIDDYLISWSGYLRTVKWPAIDRCEIACAPMAERMTTTGLRLVWSRSCPHALYSSACGLDRADWRIDGTIDSMDGLTVCVAAAAEYPDDHFLGGYIEWPMYQGAYLERRGISAHQGDTLTLLASTSSLSAGTVVSLYPGCKQTVAGCKAFNNLPNYGGIPRLPGVSPYDGRNIF